MATQFETQACTRCGGSGRYSFNLMHGDRCYGCGGTGTTYTKRGKAAKAMFHSLLERDADEITVGDNVLVSSGAMGLGPDRWHFVSEIRDDAHNPGRKILTLKRNGKVACSYGTCPGLKLRCVRTEEERAAKMAQALAYQETLLASGKPSKRKAA